MESKFPNFELHVVINLSLENELKLHLAINLSLEDKLELQLNVSVSNVSTNKKMTDCIQIMDDCVLNKNIAIIGKQLELCYNYMNEKVV